MWGLVRRLTAEIGAVKAKHYANKGSILFKTYWQIYAFIIANLKLM